MATSSNVTVLTPSAPAMRSAYGTWTHTAGAAEETLDVGGYVWGAFFFHMDASGTFNPGGQIKYSVSRDTTTGISTITIHCTADVTTGRFVVFYT